MNNSYAEKKDLKLSSPPSSLFPSPQDSFLSNGDGDVDEKESLRSSGSKNKERLKANCSDDGDRTNITNGLDERNGYGHVENFDDNHDGNYVEHHDYQDEQQRIKLKGEIEYWNKFLMIGNSSVIAFAVLTLILYFTTNIFPKEDYLVADIMTKMTNKCLNGTMMKDYDIDSFLECAAFCSDTPLNNDEETDRFLVSKPKTNETTLAISCNGKNDSYPFKACNDICQPTLTESLEYFSKHFETLCDRDRIENDNNLFEQCQSKCTPFDCCFNLDDRTNCLEENKLLCGSFFDQCAPVHENAAMFGIGVGPVLIPVDEKQDGGK